MITAGFGLVLGGLYGGISSIKETMVRMNALGPDYALGRIAKEEAMHWGDNNE